MVNDTTISALINNGIADAEIKSLKEFKPRDGFEFMDEKEFSEMLAFVRSQEDQMKEIIPFLTDNNSNFLCVFIEGSHKGEVCYLSHDEINLNPIFKSITQLIKAIDAYPEAWDILDIPAEAFDYDELPF